MTWHNGAPKEGRAREMQLTSHFGGLAPGPGAELHFSFTQPQHHKHRNKH